MSDLRGQLIEALPNLGLGRTDWEGEQTVDALMPIIEAELQKRDQEIERLRSLPRLEPFTGEDALPE